MILGFNQLSGQNKTCYLFIGTYTDAKPDKGIYIYKFDEKSGEPEYITSGENITNPSFLTISPNGHFLYACTDTKMPNSGSISAFAFDSTNGTISFINKEPSGGENPVYVNMHGNGKSIVMGNYTAGTVSAYFTNADGSLNPLTQNIQFKDSSIIKDRQDKPHIHCVAFSPEGDYLYLPDLGSDKIRAFKFDPNNISPLTEDSSLTIKTDPGSGPRHMIFHPNKKFAYCIEELSCMVSVYTYKNGKLGRIQRILSASEKDDSSGADIHISSDGLFLYASNRVENTISIFSIQKNGKLTLLGHEPTGGETPRNFAIDPSGNFLLVANQNTGNILVFSRNKKTGMLTKTNHEITVPNPTCLKMRVYGK